MPLLEKLDLELSDSKGIADPAVTHVRRVVIAQAPAWFEIECADPSCKDGGHEITHAIMRALGQQRTSFDGEDVCQGSVGSTHCGRVLRFIGTAVFRPAP